MADNPTTDADVLVFGSGAAGLTAALVAAVEGKRVVLFEKSPQIGGTTATSGGSLWVPGAREVLENTPDVDAGLARMYLENELGLWLRSDFLNAFLESSSEAIDYLAQHSEVKFKYAVNPDYHADAVGGSATGHAITAEPFDAKKLGPDFRLLRPPRDVFMVIGGMMVGRREIPQLVRPFSSLSNFRAVVSLFLRHVRDRLFYPRGTRLLIGNALVARFIYSLRQLNVTIECDTRLVDLQVEGERVTGAFVESAGKRRLVNAREAVVLATGGIAHNRKLRKELMRDFAHEHSMVAEENTGDGLEAARRVGADVDSDISNPAFWSPASVWTRPNGSQVLWIHGHMDRGKPGLLAVDASGHRFVNEADSYHDFVMSMFNERHDHGIPKAFLICDHRFIRKYGLGLVRPFVSRVSRFVKDGYLIQADSITELAKRAGIDEEGLLKTIETYNQDSTTGVDREFGRGSKALNRFNGDPSNTPNPCMAAVFNRPFYALPVSPCTIGTTVGLHTDVDSRVLGHDGQAIKGLYACGNDMSSALRGFYPGPGATLGPAVVFAYRAARHISRNKSQQDTSAVVKESI